MGHAGGAELFEDVGEKENIGEEVEVVVVLEGLHLECRPHLLGMSVIDVADVRLVQLAVERAFTREVGEEQPAREAEVVVGEDPLPLQQVGVGGMGLEIGEGVARQVGDQLLQGRRHKLQAVNEAELAERERNVFCHVVGDERNSAQVATEGGRDEVGVVSPQVVEDDGDIDVRPLSLFPPEVKAEVAPVVRRAPIHPSQMVVVPHPPHTQLTPADVALCGGLEGISVGGRHRHRYRAVDGSVDV